MFIAIAAIVNAIRLHRLIDINNFELFVAVNGQGNFFELITITATHPIVMDGWWWWWL